MPPYRTGSKTLAVPIQKNTFDNPVEPSAHTTLHYTIVICRAYYSLPLLREGSCLVRQFIHRSNHRQPDRVCVFFFRFCSGYGVFSLSLSPCLSLCLSVVFLFVLLAAVAAISLGNWVAFARRQLDIIFIQRIRNVSSSSSSPFFHFLKHLFCGVVNNFGFSCASTILFRLTSKSERQRERQRERGRGRESGRRATS